MNGFLPRGAPRLKQLALLVERVNDSSMSEDMNVRKQVEALNRALRLQHRSVLQFGLASASVVGLEFQAHADKLRSFANAELLDATRLIAKITALGGEPTTEVAPLAYTRDPGEAVEHLIDAETELLETLQAAIEPTGREAASEAVEHRLEHIIMRKQEQVDYLLRARRRP
jgi:bacterioferritin (cytochrome b1)